MEKPTQLVSLVPFVTSYRCVHMTLCTNATAEDGSLWLVNRGTEIIGLNTDIPGVNPITSVSTYEESIELCSRQGTVCRGVNFGLYSGSTTPQAYLKQRLMPANIADGGNRQGVSRNAAVDSAVRMTGPNGQNRQLLTNGDFSSGSLSPWTSSSRAQRGSAYTIGNGGV